MLAQNGSPFGREYVESAGKPQRTWLDSLICNQADQLRMLSLIESSTQSSTAIKWAASLYQTSDTSFLQL